MKGEFHIHTVYSDGEYTVDYILNYLKGNVDYFCITDHDSIIGSIEAYNKAKEYGLKALIGVEISTYLGKESVHILGYFKNEADTMQIRPFLDEIRKQRIDRLFKISDILKIHFDFDLNVDPMLVRGSITRGTIAHYMKIQAPELDNSVIFGKMIGDKSPAYVPVNKIEPQVAIDLIHKSGGVAILAHPVKLKHTDYKMYLDMGIDGYEAIYASNREEQTKELIDFCNEKGIVYTAGTDFHYFNCNNHGDLLDVCLEGEALERFIKKVNEG